jgi:hypothetical protein
VQAPEQFDDTEKLRQAGKLDAKIQQRAQLMKQNYAQLPEEEKEKDRVVARALLQAINGQQAVAEAREFKNKDEFDSLANTGDYYYTRTGNKVTKTKSGIKHERGYKKDRDDADELQERAKSKAQQKFMGMVYAAKKGQKPASKEVAKVARGMSKSDAEDFAKTKHKGLPQHVNESHNIRKHPIYTTQSAWDHYEKELAQQEVDKLHADHFEQQLDDSLSAVPQQTPIMDSDHELDEIARLAGLPNHKPTAPVIDESECNQTMEGQECPVHGLAECGMYESADENMEEGNEFSGALAKARAQGAEEFEVDGETYPVKEGKKKHDFAAILKKAIDNRNAATSSTRREIGSRVADKDPGDQEHNLRTDADRAQTVKEDVNMSISANGEEDALNLIRKLAGMPVIAISADSSEESCDTCGASPCGCDDIMQEADGGHDWDNQPEEQYAPISASIPSGTDLHKSKDMVPHNYRGGDNPLAMKESAEDRLWRQYERMKTAVKK